MRMTHPAHPGKIIADILLDLDISLRRFARAMEIAPSTASRLLAGDTSVTPEMALRLAAVIGSTAETWMKIQISFSLAEAKRTTATAHLHKLAKQS